MVASTTNKYARSTALRCVEYGKVSQFLAVALIRAGPKVPASTLTSTSQIEARVDIDEAELQVRHSAREEVTSSGVHVGKHGICEPQHALGGT